MGCGASRASAVEPSTGTATQSSQPCNHAESSEGRIVPGGPSPLDHTANRTPAGQSTGSSILARSPAEIEGSAVASGSFGEHVEGQVGEGKDPARQLLEETEHKRETHSEFPAQEVPTDVPEGGKSDTNGGAWWPPGLISLQANTSFEYANQPYPACIHGVRPSLQDAYLWRFGDGESTQYAPSDPRQLSLQRRTHPPWRKPKASIETVACPPNSLMTAPPEAQDNLANAELPSASSVVEVVGKVVAHVGRSLFPEHVPSSADKTGVADATNKQEVDALLSSESLERRCWLGELARRIWSSRTVTVFLSSVFNGMEVERSQLMEKHKPQLEELCAARGVSVVFVDMRLGITDEMGRQNLTVLTCVRGVAASDLFVGYFASGGRYGWHGPTLQSSLDFCMTEFPWIDEYRDRSVTEIEWLAGGLLPDSNCGGRGPVGSLFMYRDAEYDARQAGVMRAKVDAVLGGRRLGELPGADLREAKSYAHALSKWTEESDCPLYRDQDGTPLPLLAAKLPPAELLERTRAVGEWARELRRRKQRLSDLVTSSVSKGWGAMVTSYPDPTRGAQIQRDFLARALSAALPQAIERSVGDDQVLAHVSFATSRLRVLAGQDTQVGRITSALERWDGKPVVVSGVPGGGKSTLAARLALEGGGARKDGAWGWMGTAGRRVEAETRVQQGVKREEGFVSDASAVFWFVGCNSGSRSLSEMLDHIVSQLTHVASTSGRLRDSRHFPNTFKGGDGDNNNSDAGGAEDGESNEGLVGNRCMDGVLRDFQHLVGAWADADSWSGEGAPPVLLVIDALNQLNNEPFAGGGGASDESELLLPHSLFWLPTTFPDQMRVVLTTLSKCKEYPSGETAAVLTERGCEMVAVEALTEQERSELVTQYFKMHHKTPSSTLLERIATASAAANPMFITILLQEVICHGTYGSIDTWLSELLGADEVPALLERVLGRLVQVFNGVPDFVGRCLRTVWASREGVTEQELLGIINMQNTTSQQANVTSTRAVARGDGKVGYTKHWLPLRFAMQRLVAPRGGLWNFSHDFVRQAVERYFLTFPVQTDEVHRYHSRNENSDGTASGMTDSELLEMQPGGERTGMLVEEAMAGLDKRMAWAVEFRVRSQHAVMAAYYQVAAADEGGSGYYEETPRLLRELAYHQRRAGLSPAVTVAVRVRPFSDDERQAETAKGWTSEDIARHCSAVRMRGRQTLVTAQPSDPRSATSSVSGVKPQAFTFDYSLWSSGKLGGQGVLENPPIKQSDVFKLLGGNVIDQVVEGFDCSVLAYGQTGSGKTYTMFGPGGSIDSDSLRGNSNSSEAGLIPRTCRTLLQKLKVLERTEGLTPAVTLSVFEIYCEQVRDLLRGHVCATPGNDETRNGDGATSANTPPPTRGLRVRERKVVMADGREEVDTYVEGMSSLWCSTAEEVTRGLAAAFASRATESTAMNDVSSRSHCLAVLTVTLARLSPTPTSPVTNRCLPQSGMQMSRQHEGGEEESALPDWWVAPVFVGGGYTIVDSSSGHTVLDWAPFLLPPRDKPDATCWEPSKLRVVRTVLGGPLEGVYLEVDLARCNGSRDRAAVLHRLHVGRDVMLTCSLLYPEHGPSLVLPQCWTEPAKLVSAVVFPKSTWTAKLITTCLMAERCEEEEGGTLRAVEPARVWGLAGVRESKLNLVDLAGNERVGKSRSEGQRLAEAKAVNKSLSVLCAAIRHLAQAGTEGREAGFVEYRGSKLTMLLRNSLGGTAKIILMATISPSLRHVTETMDTLRYASMAKKIVSKATRRAEDGLLRAVVAERPQSPTSITLIETQGLPLSADDGYGRAYPERERLQQSAPLGNLSAVATAVFTSTEWNRARQEPGMGDAEVGWRQIVQGGTTMGTTWLEWDCGPGKRVHLSSYGILAGGEGGEGYVEGPKGWKLIGSNEEEPSGEGGEEEKEDWVVLDRRSDVGWHGKKVQIFRVDGGGAFRRLRWSFTGPFAPMHDADNDNYGSLSSPQALWVRSVRLFTAGGGGHGAIQTMWQVTEVRARTGALTDQITFTYADGRSESWGRSGGSSIGEFELEEGERIIKLECRQGDSLDGFRVFTDTGRQSQWFGGRGGRVQVFEASVSDPIVGIVSQDKNGWCPRIRDVVRLSATSESDPQSAGDKESDDSHEGSDESAEGSDESAEGSDESAEGSDESAEGSEDSDD